MFEHFRKLNILVEILSVTHIGYIDLIFIYIIDFKFLKLLRLFNLCVV